MPTRPDEILTLCAVGDVAVNRSDPASAFALVHEHLSGADFTFGNCESSYSVSGSPNPATRGVVRGAPSQVSGLAWAGFDVMSFANNHHMDLGYDAFFETMGHLHNAGIATCGAGQNLEEARKPTVVERSGVRVAFLGYSAIMFPGYEARVAKPGCVPLRIITEYAMSEIEQPGCPPRVTTVVHPESLAMLREDIERAREVADAIVVSAHWGLHFKPVVVAEYESELGRFAIEHGADAVIGHHQHILKGIESYRGRPIFHGLGNFVMDIDLRELADSPGVLDMQRHQPEYAVRFYPDYPTFPYHPDARRTVVAKLRVSREGVEAASFVPCLINPEGQPEPLRVGDPRFDEVASYQEEITAGAGFDTRFKREDGEVRIEL